MNTENIKHIFQSQFDYHIYCNEIVRNIFGCSDINARPELLDTSAEGDLSHYIGRMSDAEGRELGFFYTRVAEGSDVRRKRVGLRKLIAPYLKYDVDAAIAVFDDGQHWRLSYICDMKEGTTSAKRFSYVLGDKQGQYNTPVHRLLDLGTRVSHLCLKNIFDAFSVETLSKEFFDEYHRHYDRIVAELEWQGSTGALYHDYVKKMMGRIVFLHFLQKKGWLNDNQYFLRDLFFMQPLNRQSDFLEQVLEPLFFGIFNTESEKRKNLFTQRGWDVSLLNEWIELPYLNGGLFEEDDVDKLNVKLPASLFEDLFGFLASYNFTVDENDPDDAEIGVDPEMLGKIFESLLEDNKAKGAFYTPKEIVRYMCKESLIAYLSSKVDGELANGVRQFVEHHEMPEELESCRETIDTALREVKICDPAIGSGAFPMGLLNELWRCREAVEGDGVERVELKKEIIENNVYGVDIEKGAIDIARLRFWLSIVVDAEKPEPLPNFDYKFMQGNSLIESFEGHDLSSMLSETQQRRGGKVSAIQYGMNFGDKETRQNLQLLLKQYFSITDHKKKEEYRSQIDDTVKAYILQQGLPHAAELRLQTICTYANQDFFLWHTWFKDIFDKGGFDIVIGNPPYKIVGKEDVNKQYYDGHYDVAHGGKRNLYHLFFERGIRITRKEGVLSYITPDTYFSGNDTSYLRKYLVENTSIFSIIHYTEKDKIFENVTQAVAVVVLSKCQPGLDFKISDHDGSSATIKYKSLNKANGWIFKASNSIIEKMKLCASTFDDVCVGYKGDVNLGLKKVYFHPMPVPDSLPLVRGVQLNKYSYEKGDEYCLKQALSKDQTNLNRIVFQEVANMGLKHRVKGTILSNVICGDSCNIIFPNRNDIDIFYMLGILNSKVVNYYFKFFNQTNHVPIGELKKIPFPVVDVIKQKAIINIVSNILTIKKKNPNICTITLEDEIDRLVYQLYNLTPEEIAIIEQQ